MDDYEKLALVALFGFACIAMTSTAENSKVLKTGSDLDKAMRVFDEFYRFCQQGELLIKRSKGIMAATDITFDQKAQMFIYGDRILGTFEDRMLPRAMNYNDEFAQLAKVAPGDDLDKPIRFAIANVRNIKLIIEEIKRFLYRGGGGANPGSGPGGGGPPFQPFGGPLPKIPEDRPNFDSNNPGSGGGPPGPPGTGKVNAFVQSEAEFNAMQVDDRKNGGAPPGHVQAFNALKMQHAQMVQEAVAVKRAYDEAQVKLMQAGTEIERVTQEKQLLEGACVCFWSFWRLFFTQCKIRMPMLPTHT